MSLGFGSSAPCRRMYESMARWFSYVHFSIQKRTLWLILTIVPYPANVK